MADNHLGGMVLALQINYYTCHYKRQKININQARESNGEEERGQCKPQGQGLLQDVLEPNQYIRLKCSISCVEKKNTDQQA